MKNFSEPYAFSASGVSIHSSIGTSTSSSWSCINPVTVVAEPALLLLDDAVDTTADADPLPAALTPLPCPDEDLALSSSASSTNPRAQISSILLDKTP